MVTPPPILPILYSSSSFTIGLLIYKKANH